MPDQLSISDRGLRLIKAFEGYRPVDRVLVTGTRVVGHGHRLPDDSPVRMDAEAAHAQLIDDLAPFEDMINENVFASVTQGQFDALTSLAFNIGPRAFLDSDVLRAVNAGRPLEAATGFDAWRKAEIAGETYVVDALVRRRTAEKALFLRPSPDALTPRAPTTDLDPQRDADVTTDLAAPTLTQAEAGRLVADAPYELSRLITDLPSEGRRREDRVETELGLSETADPDDVLDLGEEDRDTGASATLFSDLDAVLAGPEPAATPSPIAEAADEVRDRLDALMDDSLLDDTSDDAPSEDAVDWPESLITSESVDAPLSPDAGIDVVTPDSFAEVVDETIVAFPGTREEPEFEVTTDDAPTLGAPVVVDTDAPVTVVSDSAEEEATYWSPPALERRDRRAAWPFYLIFLLGGLLLGPGLVLWSVAGVADGADIAGLPRRLVGLGLMLTGAMFMVGGLLYIMKTLLDGDEA